MNVLEGERFEQRRILFDGRPEWTTVEGADLVLMDGRRVAEAQATYLPPCEPTKILCIHLNYESRRVEFRAPKLLTPTYFQKPTTALNSHRGTLNRPGQLPLPQLRRRDRRHRRPPHEECRPRGHLGLPRRIFAGERRRLPGLPRHRCLAA